MILHGKCHNMLLFELLKSDSNMFHFMTTRLGGVSQGTYASLNFGESAGDNPDHVMENRKRLASDLSLEETDLFFPHQVHGDAIWRLDEAFLALSSDERKKAADGFDAVVTDLPGVCIGVTTADCVPLIAYDPHQKVLAAIHAGWRGTVAAIASKTIQVMLDEYGCRAENILVGIGASISLEKFEVGEEVVDSFLAAGIDLQHVSCRDSSTGKCHIDLQEVNRRLLLSQGILAGHIEVMRLCTQIRDDLFFSARRQGIRSGRMVTGGVLRK